MERAAKTATTSLCNKHVVYAAVSVCVSLSQCVLTIATECDDNNIANTDANNGSEDSPRWKEEDYVADRIIIILPN